MEASPGDSGVDHLPVYVDMNDATDRMSAVFGNNTNELSINTQMEHSTAPSTPAGT